LRSIRSRLALAAACVGLLALCSPAAADAALPVVYSSVAADASRRLGIELEAALSSFSSARCPVFDERWFGGEHERRARMVHGEGQ
jgi:hypothetical protein